MKSTALFYIASMLAVTAYGDSVNFDNETPGTLPPHWVGTQTGLGEAKWNIEKADDAPSKPNVLKESGEATFPVCIKDDTKVKDGFVEVKFKPVAGKEDQAEPFLHSGCHWPWLSPQPAATSSLTVLFRR